MKKVILYSVILVLQLCKIYKAWVSLKYLKKMYNLVTNLKKYSLSQLNIAIKDGLVKAGQYIFCRGIISADKTFKTILPTHEYAAYSQLSVTKIIQINDRVNEVTSKATRQFAPFLTLSDKEGVKAKIYQTFDTLFLTVKQLNKPFSQRQKIFNIGWPIKLIISPPSRIISSNYRQIYIPENSEVTILAKLPSTLGEKQAQLFFMKPKIISQYTKDIIKYFESWVQSQRLSLYFWIVLLIFSGYLLITVVVNRSFQQSIDESKVKQVNTIYVESRKCAKCQSTLRNVICNPCGHMSLCQKCAQGNQIQYKCFQCKQQPLDQTILFPC